MRRPDASVFLLARLEGLDRKKIPIPIAPDIAVEVLSPSESSVEVHRKALQYLAAGSQEVWQLDQENGEIFVQTNSGIRLLRGEEALEAPLLPDFSVTVNVLLAGFYGAAWVARRASPFVCNGWNEFRQQTKGAASVVVGSQSIYV